MAQNGTFYYTTYVDPGGCIVRVQVVEAIGGIAVAMLLFFLGGIGRLPLPVESK